eukprot:11653134-Alexandrium_andersonii.AAC.1
MPNSRCAALGPQITFRPARPQARFALPNVTMRTELTLPDPPQHAHTFDNAMRWPRFAKCSPANIVVSSLKTAEPPPNPPR